MEPARMTRLSEVRHADKNADTSRAWLPWLPAVMLILATDQAVKQVIYMSMPYGASHAVTSYFNLVHVWNTGAAFSLLADAGGWQRYALTALGAGVSLFLAWLLWRNSLSRLEAAAYTLVLGGALGNVSDRIARGFVVDYLDFHWRGWHWPAFNIADIAITTGAALLILASFLPAGGDRATSEKTG